MRYQLSYPSFDLNHEHCYLFLTELVKKMTMACISQFFCKSNNAKNCILIVFFKWPHFVFHSSRYLLPFVAIFCPLLNYCLAKFAFLLFKMFHFFVSLTPSSCTVVPNHPSDNHNDNYNRPTITQIVERYRE